MKAEGDYARGTLKLHIDPEDSVLVVDKDRKFHAWSTSFMSAFIDKMRPYLSALGFKKGSEEKH